MSQSVARRRIEDRARHHVVAARLEHQPGADPVEFGEEMRAPLHHRRALEQRPAAGDQPHRIAAGMAVDAEEGVSRHGGLRTAAGGRARRSIAGACPRTRSRIKRAGGRRLRQAEMAVAEGIERHSAWPARLADHRQRVRQRRAEPHPFAAAAGDRAPAGIACAFFSMRLRARDSWADASRPPSSTAPPTRMPVSSGVTTKPWPEKISMRFRSKARCRQRGVVAALGLQRDAVAELARPADATRRRRRRPAVSASMVRPCSSWMAIRPFDGTTSLDVAVDEARASGFGIGPDRLAEQLWVGNGLPARHESASTKRGERPGCNPSSPCPVDMAEVDAEALAREPSREARP